MMAYQKELMSSHLLVKRTADVLLLASGSEVNLAVEAQQALAG